MWMSEIMSMALKIMIKLNIYFLLNQRFYMESPLALFKLEKKKWKPSDKENTLFIERYKKITSNRK